MTRIGYGLLAALMLTTTVAMDSSRRRQTEYRSPRRAAATLTACALGRPPVKDELKACMKAHVSQLSASCFDTLMAAAAAKKEQ